MRCSIPHITAFYFIQRLPPHSPHVASFFDHAQLMLSTPLHPQCLFPLSFALFARIQLANFLMMWFFILHSTHWVHAGAMSASSWWMARPCSTKPNHTSCIAPTHALRMENGLQPPGLIQKANFWKHNCSHFGQVTMLMLTKRVHRRRKALLFGNVFLQIFGTIHATFHLRRLECGVWYFADWVHSRSSSRRLGQKFCKHAAHFRPGWIPSNGAQHQTNQRRVHPWI